MTTSDVQPRPKFEWQLLSSVESSGSSGVLGVRIQVMMDRDLNDQDSSMGYRVMRDIQAALALETARLDPKTNEFRDKEKAEIEKAFADAGLLVVFMDPIPNEYFGDKDPWSLKSPWYTVTTPLGHFKVGWRKRVLVLDWERTVVKTTADTLFQHEDVTKGDRMIHCWSYDKATEYLKRVQSSWESCKFK